MNILFYLPIPRPDKFNYTPFHRGVGQIGALLKQAGHQVFLRMPHAIKEQDTAKHIIKYGADAVFVSLASPQAHCLAPIAGAARTAGCKVLVGGPHATFAPAEVLKTAGVTAIVRGEGEEGACRFLAEEKAQCPGLIYRDALAAGLDQTGPGSPVHTFGRLAEINALPMPDRAMFLDCPEFIQEKGIMGLELAASRGCPFNCTYCSNKGYNQVYGSAFSRRLAVDQVLAEAESGLSLFPRVSIAGFHDDIFTLDAAWLADFAAAWKAWRRFPFWVNAHPSLLDAERVHSLKEAGCVRVHMGVETGNPALRETVLGRHLSNQTILNAALRCREAGLKVVTFVMLGIPGETEASFQETVTLLKAIKPDRIIQSYFVPLPGTDLHKQLSEASPWDNPENYHSGFYGKPIKSWAHNISVSRLHEMGKKLNQKDLNQF